MGKVVGVRRFVLLMASLALAGLLTSGVGLLLIEEPASASFPVQNGKIAYRSYARGDGSGGIYVMNPDGSGQSHVANTGGGIGVQPPGSADVTPAWSLDGTKIAFSRVTAAYDICVTNSGGSNQIVGQ